MIYSHRFIVRDSLERVSEFHRRSGSMGAITPPPIVARVHRAPPVLSENDEMEFTLWLGPLPVRWLARIEDVTPSGFSDRQLSGPFERWVHRHTFRALSDEETEVLDEITLRLRLHPLWLLVGLGMFLGLPVLFAFRGWKTRQFLEVA